MLKSNFYRLHQKYAGGRDRGKFLDLTWTHSDIVRQIANQFVDRLERQYSASVDKDLVEAGALLHDIGVYVCFDDELNPDDKLPKYISHGHEGYRLLKEEGLGEKIARFALTHTGTGITVEDMTRENLPFGKNDCIPITLEEEIVCYADKFHTKWPSFNTFEEAKSRLEKFDQSKGIIMDRFRKKFGLPDIGHLTSRYAEWHKKFHDYFASIHKS